MILQNITTAKGTNINIHIRNGKIASISENLIEFPPKEEILDASGYLLLPAFFDTHAHLDKTVLGMDWFYNDLGSNRIDRIENERKNRTSFGIDTFRQASRLMELSISKGTLYMRSHVDIDTDNGLKGLEGVLQAKEKYKDIFHLELAAFPQSGLLIRPGTYELMEKALEMGADIVGGIDPAEIDRDPKGSVHAIFQLAEKYNRPIDIHLHEAEELGAFTMGLIIEHTLASGMQGKVSISHAFCLGSQKKELVVPLLEGLAHAGITIITCGQPNTTSVPRIREVSDAGINICGGNDDIRDMWSPYGSGDILERIQFIAMKNYFRKDKDLEFTMKLCTENAAKLFNIEKYGPYTGNPATFVLVKARNISESIVTYPKERMVFCNGKMIAKDWAYLG
ncbi:MAG: amidohydrolase family protein [Fusobacteriaceae bacterium]|nr:amidohydrolase family protein [Fusobacteriaceae bacterium]